MVKVALQGVKFFAYHGYYPEEQVVGGHFIADATVHFVWQRPFTDDEIEQTINYEILYGIIARQMEQPRKLLETVVQAILDDIKVACPSAQSIRVSLKKLNPPLPGQVDSSLVEITYNKPIA